MSFPDHRTAVLTGHNGPVHCVTFSAGLGQYILTGASDRTIRLFNPQRAGNSVPAASSIRGGAANRTNTPRASVPGLVQTYEAHGYEVLDIAVSDDNARFASVGGDRQVFLWDVTTGKTLRRWAGHVSRVNAVAFGGDDCSVVISGSFDATIRIWDCKSQSTKPIQVLDEARDSISSVDVLGHEIAVGCVDGRVRLYDLRMGMVSVDVVGPSVTCVRQTRDGQGTLVSTLDSTLRLLDKGNGQLLQSYRGHVNQDYRVRATLAFGDATVLAGSEDGHVYAWDFLSGAVVARIPAHGGKVVSAVAANASRTGRREWASAGGDGNVFVWGMPANA